MRLLIHLACGSPEQSSTRRPCEGTTGVALNLLSSAAEPAATPTIGWTAPPLLGLETARGLQRLGRHRPHLALGTPWATRILLRTRRPYPLEGETIIPPVTLEGVGGTLKRSADRGVAGGRAGVAAGSGVEAGTGVEARARVEAGAGAEAQADTAGAVQRLGTTGANAQEVKREGTGVALPRQTAVGPRTRRGVVSALTGARVLSGVVPAAQVLGAEVHAGSARARSSRTAGAPGGGAARLGATFRLGGGAPRQGTVSKGVRRSAPVAAARVMTGRHRPNFGGGMGPFARQQVVTRHPLT